MAGKYEPTVESLQHYECPQWFRESSSGSGHAGTPIPCSESETGTPVLYIQGHEHYNYRVENYGHSSEFGYEEFSLNV